MQAPLLAFAASGFHEFGATMCFVVVVESVASKPGAFRYRSVWPPTARKT